MKCCFYSGALQFVKSASSSLTGICKYVKIRVRMLWHLFIFAIMRINNFSENKHQVNAYLNGKNDTIHLEKLQFVDVVEQETANTQTSVHTVTVKLDGSRMLVSLVSKKRQFQIEFESYEPLNFSSKTFAENATQESVNKFPSDFPNRIYIGKVVGKINSTASGQFYNGFLYITIRLPKEAYYVKLKYNKQTIPGTTAFSTTVIRKNNLNGKWTNIKLSSTTLVRDIAVWKDYSTHFQPSTSYRAPTRYTCTLQVLVDNTHFILARRRNKRYGKSKILEALQQVDKMYRSMDSDDNKQEDNLIGMKVRNLTFIQAFNQSKTVYSEQDYRDLIETVHKEYPFSGCLTLVLLFHRQPRRMIQTPKVFPCQNPRSNPMERTERTNVLLIWGCHYDFVTLMESKFLLAIVIARQTAAVLGYPYQEDAMSSCDAMDESNGKHIMREDYRQVDGSRPFNPKFSPCSARNVTAFFRGHPNASCTDFVCGDGVVSQAEDCEPCQGQRTSPGDREDCVCCNDVDCTFRSTSENNKCANDTRELCARTCNGTSRRCPQKGQSKFCSNSRKKCEIDGSCTQLKRRVRETCKKCCCTKNCEKKEEEECRTCCYDDAGDCKQRSVKRKHERCTLYLEENRTRKGVCDGKGFCRSVRICGDGFIDKPDEQCECKKNRLCWQCCDRVSCKYKKGSPCENPNFHKDCRKGKCDNIDEIYNPSRYCGTDSTDRSLICSNGTRVCIKGECVGHVCQHYNLTECSCTENAKQCSVCCLDSGRKGECTPLKEIKGFPSKRRIQLLEPKGTKCKDKGKDMWCDGKGNCNVPICGNAVKEGNEDCDCGSDTGDRTTCPCCTKDCKFVPISQKLVCSAKNAKQCHRHVCEGESQLCPAYVQNNLCNEGQSKCDILGDCKHSLCAGVGQECTCKEESQQCFKCCMNGDRKCMPVHTIDKKYGHLMRPLWGKGQKLCNVRGIKGFCDGKGNCTPAAGCGNGILEAGEECDCPPTNPCPCCDKDCRLVPISQKLVCSWQNATECQRHICEGQSPFCPTYVMNNLCDGGRKACDHKGKCAVSLCARSRLSPCKCTEEDKQCFMCCKSREGNCEPVHTLDEKYGQLMSPFLKVQTPCKIKNSRGVCDGKGSCKPENTCGNGIVDEGETCDCSSCPCCSKDCKLVPKEEKLRCSKHSHKECFPNRTCDGRSPDCPKIVGPKLCDNGTKSCTPEGECKGDLCAYFKTTKCQCSEEKFHCQVCCQEAGNKCLPLSNFTSQSAELRGIKGLVYLQPGGTKCVTNGRLGYCSKTGQCTKRVICGDGFQEGKEACDCLPHWGCECCTHACTAVANWTRCNGRGMVCDGLGECVEIIKLENPEKKDALPAAGYSDLGSKIHLSFYIVVILVVYLIRVLLPIIGHVSTGLDL